METITRKELFVRMIDEACAYAEDLLTGQAEDVLTAQGYFRHAFEEAEKAADKVAGDRDMTNAVHRIERKLEEVLKAAYTDRDFTPTATPMEHFRTCANCRKLRDWVCGMMRDMYDTLKKAECFAVMHEVYSKDFIFMRVKGVECYDGVPCEG